MHCRAKPYPNTLPKFTLSFYIAELFAILIQCQNTPSEYITELYPISIHYRSMPYVNTMQN